MAVTLEFPLRTHSLNHMLRTHWASRSKVVKKQRNTVWAEWSSRTRPKIAFPAVVTLTRIAPQANLDGDNLQGSLKHVRDEVARQIGIDDGDAWVTWEYAQERSGKRGDYRVRVEITGIPIA